IGRLVGKVTAEDGRPVDHLRSDLYLVEFPKSGITWLSFLVANVNLLLSGRGDQEATFFNIHDLVPDIHVGRQLGPPATLKPGYRIIKSHNSFNPLYYKVVYLARDPRHVMPSYHAFLRELGHRDWSLEEMVRDPTFGIRAWCRHVHGWT